MQLLLHHSYLLTTTTTTTTTTNNKNTNRDRYRCNRWLLVTDRRSVCCRPCDGSKENNDAMILNVRDDNDDDDEKTIQT